MSKEQSQKQTKNKSKENIFKKITKYFKGVKKEMGRIKWTSGKDMVKYSAAALTFVIFFCLYFYLVELGAAFIRSLV